MKCFKSMVVVLALFSLFFVGCKGAAKTNKIRAGFVYVGPIGDGGWTKAHDDGRLEMEKLDFVEPSKYVESVPEGAEAERVITQLIEASNCNVIFTTSFGYMDPTLEVAKKYPNVKFEHCSGYKTSDNMGTYYGRFYQAKFLGGMVAGLMTKTNKIGYVAPHPIPEIFRLVNAFTLGVRSVNPKATVQVVWTNSWFDPGKELDAANSMIENGCDVITQGADSPAPQQAAEKAGIYTIGHDTDMKDYAPKAHLTATVWHWGVVYKKIVQEIHDGTWTSKQHWDGIETGIVGLTDFNPVVPEDVKAKVKAKEDALKAGNDDVFKGPIYDQDGNLKVKEGEELSDQDKLTISWFVQGVKGSNPKKAE